MNYKELRVEFEKRIYIKFGSFSKSYKSVRIRTLFCFHSIQKISQILIPISFIAFLKYILNIISLWAVLFFLCAINCFPTIGIEDI